MFITSQPKINFLGESQKMQELAKSMIKENEAQIKKCSLIIKRLREDMDCYGYIITESKKTIEKMQKCIAEKTIDIKNSQEIIETNKKIIKIREQIIHKYKHQNIQMIDSNKEM